MSTRTYQAPETSPPGGAARARWLALAVLCIPLLMVNLDNLVLNVALPTLVRDLRASTTELQWIVDAYVIVFAGLLLVAGSVADRIGRKRVFIAGLAAFAAGSTWAAFSGSAGMLIAARASMGIGGAMMMPSTLAIITSLFSEPRYPVGHRVGSGLAARRPRRRRIRRQRRVPSGGRCARGGDQRPGLSSPTSSMSSGVMTAPGPR